MDHYRRSLRNCFTSHSVDRLTARREDPQWVSARLYHQNARIVPIWRSASLITDGGVLAPALLDAESLDRYLGASDAVLLGEHDGLTYFALDLPADGDCPEQLSDFGRFRDLKEVGGILEQPVAGLLAYARGLTYWHRRHRFCGDCGYPTRSASAGHLRICTNTECERQQFPRTDPAVIVLVHREDRCLLARQSNWPQGVHSVLAGFGSLVRAWKGRWLGKSWRKRAWS